MLTRCFSPPAASVMASLPTAPGNKHIGDRISYFDNFAGTLRASDVPIPPCQMSSCIVLTADRLVAN